MRYLGLDWNGIWAGGSLLRVPDRSLNRELVDLTRLLPGPCSSTNFLILKFPIICRKIGRGENVFCLDSTKLGEYLDLRDIDIEFLSTALCDRPTQVDEHKSSAQGVDPIRRALEYKSLMDAGIVKNQSGLAQYLGKSRAWVSNAMIVSEKGKI